MTKLSISLAAAILSVALAPAAQAYSTEPAPQTFSQISQVAPLGPQTVKVEGTCTLQVTPMLASLLGLQQDWGADRQAPAQSTVVCSQK